jgi:hypothetical protein
MVWLYLNMQENNFGSVHTLLIKTNVIFQQIQKVKFVCCISYFREICFSLYQYFPKFYKNQTDIRWSLENSNNEPKKNGGQNLLNPPPCEKVELYFSN